jgi:hypothetical protein
MKANINASPLNKYAHLKRIYVSLIQVFYLPSSLQILLCFSLSLFRNTTHITYPARNLDQKLLIYQTPTVRLVMAGDAALDCTMQVQPGGGREVPDTGGPDVGMEEIRS